MNSKQSREQERKVENWFYSHPWQWVALNTLQCLAWATFCWWRGGFRQDEILMYGAAVLVVGPSWAYFWLRLIHYNKAH